MNNPNNTQPSAPAGQNVWMETENAIVNSIMSGVNSCDTLKKHIGTAEAGDPMPLVDFLRGAVRAGNQPRSEEWARLVKDLNSVRASEEDKRQFCEFVASNLGAGVRVEEHAKELFENAFRRALPGRQI